MARRVRRVAFRRDVAGVLARATMVSAAFGAAIACQGDQAVATAARSPATTLNVIAVSPLNAIMAVGEQLPLSIHGTSLTNVTIADYDSVAYSLQNVVDTLRVQLSTTGVLTAIEPSSEGAPVLVNVIAYKDGIAAADQAVVQIVPVAFSGATLSIQVVAPDSAKLQWTDRKMIMPVVQNGTGGAVDYPTVRFEYGPGDSTVLQCYVPTIQGPATLTPTQLGLSHCPGTAYYGTPGLDQIIGARRGTAWVHANVMVFGVMLHDSVQYTVTNMYEVPIVVSPFNFFTGETDRSSVYLAPGGTFDVINGFDPGLGVTLDIAFDHPENALATNPPSTYGGTSGNVIGLTADQYVATRRFVAPGVYHWTATVNGGIPPYTGSTASGTLTVE